MMAEKNVSRRRVLMTAGVISGGAFGLGRLFGQEGLAETTRPSRLSSAPPLPWSLGKYRFDPDAVRQSAYEAFYEGECMFAVAATLIRDLQAKIGAPFTTIPVDMFRYGGGGIAGWGTVCGTINGGAAVLNLLGETSSYQKLINDLFDWYSKQSFPSKDHDAYAKFQNQTQTVSKSPICHISVTTWVDEARKKRPSITALSPERADRCAKVAGDVASHVARMINAHYDKTYAFTYKPSPDYAPCVTCHVDVQNAYNLNVKAQMNCTTCHVDINKVDLANHPPGGL